MANRIDHKSPTPLGGAGGNRTHDLRVKSPLLCQLSYGPAPQDTALRSPLPFEFAWGSPPLWEVLGLE